MDEFTIGESNYSPLSDGEYTAEFGGIEQVQTVHGLSNKFVFEIQEEGEHKGEIFNAFCDSKPPTIKNKLGRYLAFLAHASLTSGIVVKPSNYIGKQYLLFIEGGKLASFQKL